MPRVTESADILLRGYSGNLAVFYSVDKVVANLGLPSFSQSSKFLRIGAGKPKRYDYPTDFCNSIFEAIGSFDG